MMQRLMSDGYFLNASAYPAVPLGNAGVRFTQTLHHTPEQPVVSRRGSMLFVDFEDLGVAADVVVDLRDGATEIIPGS